MGLFLLDHQVCLPLMMPKSTLISQAPLRNGLDDDRGKRAEGIFDWIPLDNVIVDELHCILRCYDMLQRGLLRYLESEDKVHGTTLRLQFLEAASRAGVKMRLYEKDNRISSITGGQKRQLLEKIDFSFLSSALAAKVTRIWRALFKLHSNIVAPEASIVGNDFRKNVLVFIDLIVQCEPVYTRADLSCFYLHALCDHVGDQLSRYGSLLWFSTSSIEKRNDLVATVFRKGTTKGGGRHSQDPLKSIISREYALVLLDRQLTYLDPRCSFNGGELLTSSVTKRRSRFVVSSAALSLFLCVLLCSICVLLCSRWKHKSSVQPALHWFQEKVSLEPISLSLPLSVQLQDAAASSGASIEPQDSAGWEVESECEMPIYDENDYDE